MCSCSNSLGRKRDGKRSECPKGNNMPASERAAAAMAMDERRNIIFGHQGSLSLPSLSLLETSSKYVNDSTMVVEGSFLFARPIKLEWIVVSSRRRQAAVTKLLTLSLSEFILEFTDVMMLFL